MTPPYQYRPCFCHTKYYFSVDNTQINISSSDFSPKHVLSYPPSGDKKSPLHCPLCLHQIRYFHLYLWLCQEYYHFLGQQKLKIGGIFYCSSPCQASYPHRDTVNSTMCSSFFYISYPFPFGFPPLQQSLYPSKWLYTAFSYHLNCLITQLWGEISGNIHCQVSDIILFFYQMFMTSSVSHNGHTSTPLELQRTTCSAVTHLPFISSLCFWPPLYPEHPVLTPDSPHKTYLSEFDPNINVKLR